MDEQAVLARQVKEWMAEIKRLAGQVSAASGGGVAFVQITAPTESTDVAAELIVEDVLGVAVRGWPQGYSIDILNRRA